MIPIDVDCLHNVKEAIFFNQSRFCKIEKERLTAVDIGESVSRLVTKR